MPKEKVFTKAKRWTLLEVTAFTGTPVMYVVIFTGKKRFHYIRPTLIHSLTSKAPLSKPSSLIIIMNLASFSPEDQNTQRREMRCLPCVAEPPKGSINSTILTYTEDS